MKNRMLGKSGLSVSEIGMGCWQLGGDFGPMDDDRATATLAAARAAGITFFDTADVYGGGRSEERIGRFIDGRHDGVVVGTKVGRTADLYPDNYRLEDVRRHLRESAKRLGKARLDLVQLHCVPPRELETGEIFETMEKLRAEGLCRAWGASVETIDEAMLCLDHPGLTSLQIIFSLFRQDPKSLLFSAAERANVGIIVRLPLASGLLGGKLKHGDSFPESDHRHYNRDGAAFSVGETFSGLEFDKGVALADRLKTTVPEGMSLADMALRWILDHSAVTTVIAGCSKPEQASRNARVSELPPLSPALHEMLARFYDEQVRDLIRGRR